MTKAEEAHDYVFEKIKELEEEYEDLEVDYRKDDRESWDDARESLMEKYKGDENRVDPIRWYQICFQSDSEEVIQEVYDLQTDLFEIGIYFDTGAGLGCNMVWELDWSFRIEKEVDEDKIDRASWVNDMRKGLLQ